jgi:hypothetical protein
LIYSMLISLDGYIEDASGNFSWGAPNDPQMHGYLNDMAAGIGTYHYGRRIYDTMVFWEGIGSGAAAPAQLLDWVRLWQAADRIVYFREMSEARSARADQAGL